MAQKCDQCNDSPVYQVTLDSSDKKWKCDKCYRRRTFMKVGLGQKEYLEGYGWVSKARIDELNRRVVLSYQKGSPDSGEYYLGRRDDSGRIQEKAPNYYK